MFFLVLQKKKKNFLKNYFIDIFNKGNIDDNKNKNNDEDLLIERKMHYCLKVRKVDAATGQTVEGAEFEASNPALTINKDSGSNYYDSTDGVVSFFIEDPTTAGQFNVTETKAPAGYEKDIQDIYVQ